jgi:hypothetical protein
VSSIDDLGVRMDGKMNFSEHVDVMVDKAFAMLGYTRRLSFKFRDPYNLFGSSEAGVRQLYGAHSMTCVLKVDCVQFELDRFLLFVNV